MPLKGFTLWLSRGSVLLFFPTASDLSKDKEKREHSHAGRYGVAFIGKETLYFLFFPTLSGILCFFYLLFRAFLLLRLSLTSLFHL
jgi:hypothetical protein